MAKCPFCGSEKTIVNTPFVKKVGYKGETVSVTTFCCQAQKKNNEYLKKRFHPDYAPDIEDVSKL